VSYIRWLKVLSVFVALAEVYESFKHIVVTGRASLAWGVIMSVLVLAVMAKVSFKPAGALMVALAALFWLSGLLMLLLVPGACWGDDEESWERDCGLPPDFNHRAIFNVLSAVAVVCLYIGVMAKLQSDGKSHAPLPTEPPAPASPPASPSSSRRCC